MSTATVPRRPTPRCPRLRSPTSAARRPRPTATDAQLTAGTTYFYVVKSRDARGGSSGPSMEVSATTAAAPACFTATNFDHVIAGRAHDDDFFAVANGSDQVMGLDNVFIITTLKQTGPNFYVIGACP